MAGEPRSGHARADSAIDRIDPIPKTLVTAQDFCTAVSSFTTHDGFKALVEVLDLLPQRDKDIKARNDTVRDLEDKLAAQEKSHKTRTQQQISDFEDRFKNWIEEKSALEIKAKELQVTSDVKDKEFAVLREDLEMNKSRVEDLEGDIIQKTTRLKEMIQQAGMSEGRLQKMQTAVDNHLKEVEQSRNDIVVLRKSLEDNENRNRILEEKAAKIKKRLEHHLRFSVEMEELNLPETIDRIENLWQSAIRLIVDFAGQELPKDILQIDWTEFRENDVFKDKIPLPQSNSDVAKMMRVAMVLGALATLVNKFVFQPTYLLNEKSGLREILSNQAGINPGKERFTRGILLSMSLDVQEANSEEVEDVVDSIVDELLDNAIIQVLLGSESIPAFENALVDLIIQFQEEWKVVQRGKQKLEASFRHSHSTDHPWHVLDMRARNVGEDQNTKASFDSSNLQEDDTVIVPRVYLIRTGGEKTPMTHGYVLRKAHLDAAKEEARRDLQTATFARAPSGRQHRRRSFRTATVSSHAPSSSSGRKGDRFLSRARGALGV